MTSKALEMGVCFHSGPAFGKYGGDLFLRAFERKKSYLENFFMDLERYEKCPVNRYLSIGGPVGELDCQDF
jgi:hypothetical protein